MHHVLIMLTLTFIEGHSDLNHENKKCLKIGKKEKNIQAMLIKSAVKIGWLDVSDDIDLHSRSQMSLKLEIFLT